MRRVSMRPDMRRGPDRLADLACSARAPPPGPHSTGIQAVTNLRASASVVVSLKVVRRSLTNLLFQEVTQR